jgi:hypothetical protein
VQAACQKRLHVEPLILPFPAPAPCAVYGDDQHETIASDSHAANVDADGANRWKGVTTAWLPTTWRSPVQCAYALTVSVSSRSQTGYGPAASDSYTKTPTYLAGTGAPDCK